MWPFDGGHKFDAGHTSLMFGQTSLGGHNWADNLVCSQKVHEKDSSSLETRIRIPIRVIVISIISK